MGRDWRSAGPKARARRVADLRPEEERVYKKIRLAAEMAMREDAALEKYEYRVRYRYGYPCRIHYRTKTKLLIDLMNRVAAKQVSHRWALQELEAIKREP